MTSDKQLHRKELRARSRWVYGHGPTPPVELLARTAAWCADNDIRADDYYGTGALIEDFESRVAERLGFAAGRFMPSGTMAQQIALRVWSERAGLSHIGMHPTSHVEVHEQRGYAHLHGLRATLVGPAYRPLLAEHFEAIKERMAALLIELPIREAGGQCPTWEELEALKAAIARSDTRLHLDGARLWECAAWFARPYHEICAGFDSVYVSFYKGIGALSGAMLLGDRQFIDEAALWQKRCGGNLYSLAPYVASAAMLFDERLSRMPAYYRRARELARALAAIDGVVILPDPPHVNLMHMFLALDADAALDARDRVAEDTGLWLFNGAGAADMPGHCRFEWYVGDAALEVDVADVVAGFRALLER